MINHVYCSPSQAKAAELLHASKMAALYSPGITDVEAAKKMLKNLIEGMKDPESEAAKTAIAEISQFTNTVNDVRAGRISDPVHKSLTVVGEKAAMTSVSPMLAQQVAMFINLFNEDDIDNYWESIFQVDVVTNTKALSIHDVKHLVKFERLKGKNEKVPYSRFAASTWEKITPNYYGGGVAVDEDALMLDPLVSANAIIIAIRVAAEVRKTEEMTTMTQAAIAAANSASYTTAFATSIANTLNVARRALIQRNKNKGFNLNGNTVVVVLASEAHRGLLEAAFPAVDPSLNVNYGTIRPAYPFNRIYTENVAPDLGISGNKVAVILPFRKNRMGLFSPLGLTAVRDAETQEAKYIGREAYEAIAEEEQFQITAIS